jgi:signal transduction histidine kinase/FixJ family two-component response regulator
MTTGGSKGGQGSTRRAWTLGVGARLLLAFFGIAAFAVVAAGAGLYAFREVGGRLAVVEARVPPALAALELSRSAERIIAAAPALLAAAERARRDDVRAALAAEVERLNRNLADLKGREPPPPPLQEIDAIAASLIAGLGELDAVVARRLATSERVAALRREIFTISSEVQRLLAPWLEVTDSEIAAILDGPGEIAAAMSGAQREQLASLVRLQRTTEAVQRQVSSVVDMLAEASTSEDTERIPILRFQLGLALADLAETSTGLDPRLRPLFLDRLARLRDYAEGPDAVAEARWQELSLIAEGEMLLAQTAELSAQLTAAVDRLGAAAKRDIGTAVRDALQVQRLSAQVLLALVALSLLTSVVIVWRYVGGSIVRRLTALSEGTLAIAAGRLRTPIEVEGSDEIAAMGRAVEVFRRNTLERDDLLAQKAMAADVLEQEVKQRTAELEVANAFKSRFLAAASHDLRQPLHALNLFVAQLRDVTDPVERRHLVARIDAAAAAMGELFESLLDMSKLEAGILEPKIDDFAVAPLLKRLETTFAETARGKGLRLRVVPCGAWVRSDFILLERILLNLAANAVRCTQRGGVVIGCRRRGARLRFDVWDSGPGIPDDQQRNIFAEFHQLAPRRSESAAGLGLGLSIVDGLARLLDHPVELASRVGRGSRFSVSVPAAVAREAGADRAGPPAAVADPLPGKLVVVIDDDELVLEGMRGILLKWGCRVVTASSGAAAAERVAEGPARPDLVVSDYRLASGETGVQAITRVAEAAGSVVPAFLMTGDMAPERLRDAAASGYHLLHKPIAPMALRSMLHRMLSGQGREREPGRLAAAPASRRAAGLRGPEPRRR